MSYFAAAAEEAASPADEAAAVASAAADEAAAAASEAAAAASEAADEASEAAVAAGLGLQATVDRAATAAPATRILRRTSEVMVLVPFGG